MFISVLCGKTIKSNQQSVDPCFEDFVPVRVSWVLLPAQLKSPNDINDVKDLC